MSAPVIIVGAGQAAASYISRHVALENQQPVLLIGEEPHPPYQRPPLSKKYLLGQLELERLFIRPLDWYQEQNVELRLNTRVESIDRDKRQLTCKDGNIIDYSKLVLSEIRVRAAKWVYGDQRWVRDVDSWVEVSLVVVDADPATGVIIPESIVGSFNKGELKMSD